MNAPGGPTFSVLVPLFNHARYVGAALDSLLAQSDPDWEAVVVNDGSTDESGAVVAGYAARDPRIRLIDQENGGTAVALNTALRASRGRWICWLSSDDLFDARKLEIHRRWIRDHPTCSLFHSHFRYLDDATGEITDAQLWREMPSPEWHLMDMLAGTSIHGNSVCIVRDALLEAGGFDPRYRNAQDYDMWLRLLARHRAVFIPERTCTTRMHAAQGTATFARAGYYDSAWAGIGFLSTHALAQCFPALDLGEPGVLEAVVQRTLDVAASPASFVYALGPHPLLFLRALEAVDGCGSPARRAALRRLVLQACERLQAVDAGGMAFYGRALSAALRSSGLGFSFASQTADDIAALQLGVLSRFAAPEAEELSRYLRRDVDDVRKAGVPGLSEDLVEVLVVGQSGVLLPIETTYGAMHATSQVARVAQQAGLRVLIAALSKTAFGFERGVPFVGARDEAALRKVLLSFGRADGVIAVSRADALDAARAPRRLVYQHDPCAPRGATSVRALNLQRTHVACVSRFSRRLLMGLGLRPALLHVVRNGYDHATFRVHAGIVRRPHSLVMAGTVVHYKGTDVALEALRILQKTFPDATLSIYGDNLPWSQIPTDFQERGLVDADGRLVWDRIESAYPGVRYYGPVGRRELAAAFSAHDLLVMPSSMEETFGLVSLEAQACGCLPVLPDRGGFPETVLPDATGFLYADNTAEGLAERVLELWSAGSPTEAQRVRAQAWVGERFSWERTGARLLYVLDATGAERRSRVLGDVTAIRGQDATRALLRLITAPQRLAAHSDEYYYRSEVRRVEGRKDLFLADMVRAAVTWPFNLKVYYHAAALSVPRSLRGRRRAACSGDTSEGR